MQGLLMINFVFNNEHELGPLKNYYFTAIYHKKKQKTFFLFLNKRSIQTSNGFVFIWTHFIVQLTWVQYRITK